MNNIGNYRSLNFRFRPFFALAIFTQNRTFAPNDNAFVTQNAHYRNGKWFTNNRVPMNVAFCYIGTGKQTKSMVLNVGSEWCTFAYVHDIY